MGSKHKIALLGPVFPYRGGIAQYNTQLHRVLQKYGPTQTISFKRMYPRWLYPGKSDVEPKARGEHEKDVAYIIDVYSPFSLRRAAQEVIKSDCDIALFTWWTFFWQPGFAYVAWRLKRRGIKIVFLCHNVIDHDAHSLIRKLSLFFLKQADGYIVHATEEAKTIEDLGIRSPILNMKSLPVYQHYPAAKRTLPKRGRLEVLFFGFIRPYKGLNVLIDALAQLNDKEVFVTVVGEAWGDRSELEKELKDKRAPNLELHLEYVNDEKAAEFFKRADVIALPYISATGSAVASLAYHYKKPVLATRVGGLKESVIEGETGWLVEPDSSTAIVKTLRKIDRKKAAKMAPAIKTFCKQNSWDNLAKRIYDFTDKL